MATKDMERVSHLEGAYEHMATKAELADLNGDYRVEFTRIEHQFVLIERRFEAIDQRFEAIDQRFEVIEETMRSMQADIRGIQEVLVQIMERLDRLESLNTRALGFQTESRTLRDDGDEFLGGP